jgi:hypothetical protein
VRQIVVDFREAVQTNCGAVAVRELGFAGDTPRDPVALEKLAEAVIAKVEKHPPRANRKGVRFDARAALEGLDAEVRALAKANADVLREKREEQSARSRRDRAWTDFDREHTATVNALDARFRSVGLDDLADRITPGAHAASAPETTTPASPATTTAEPKPT